MLPPREYNYDEGPGHCPAHNSRYIDYNNGAGIEDLRCPLCGRKKSIVVESTPTKQESNSNSNSKEQQQKQQVKIRKKDPTKGKKNFAISQPQDRDRSSKKKSQGQIEIEKELGGREISNYEDWDL